MNDLSIFEKFDLDHKTDAELVMDKWERGLLTDDEADEQLLALANQARRNTRIACGLSPEPEYHN